MATPYELIYDDVFLQPVKTRIRRFPEGLVKTGVRSLTNDQGLIPAGSEAQLQQIGNSLFRALIPRPQEARDGVARLRVVAYGAFTVGVEADEGKTQLELDLAELPKVPKAFRES